MWKSHGTPKYIPVKKFPNVKFMAMARNGLDVVNSLIPFFDQHSDEFRAMWGGFPPKGTGDMAKDREARINDLLPGGMLGALYFDYVKEWWPLRNEPNVLFMHYADAIKDLPGTVTKIADFVGVKLSSSEHAKVTEKCGMQYMKSVTHMFTYSVPLNKEFNARDARIMTKGALTRKGGIGEGKETFTAAQIIKWQEAEEKMLTEPGMLKVRSREEISMKKVRKWLLIFAQLLSSGRARAVPYLHDLFLDHSGYPIVGHVGPVQHVASITRARLIGLFCSVCRLFLFPGLLLKHRRSFCQK